MVFFSRNAPSSPATRESVRRKSAPEDYFKSRAIYCSERGTILVDAFRFVHHCAVYTQPVSNSSVVSSGPSPSSHAKRQAAKTENGSSQLQSGPHKFFFLSHFHSDHYTGIQSSWHTDIIYCSRATAVLTQAELGVSSTCLFPMDFNETYVFSLQTGTCLACVPETPLHPRVQAILRGSPPSPSLLPLPTARPGAAAAVGQEDAFAVRLIPANHCPGAAILLFVSPLFGAVVHTGDFRFNGTQRRWRDSIGAPDHRTYVSIQQIQRQARLSTASQITDVPQPPPYEQFIEDDVALREVAAQEAVDVLFLDNTFCDPPYKFPTQWEVTQTVIEVLRSLFCRAAGRKSAVPSFSPQRQQQQQQASVRCAVFIGCYTIGKERVALAIRDAFARAPCQLSTPPMRGAPSSETDAQKDDQEPNWRIYVSPSRYSMLTAIDFFPDYFQPLLPSVVKRDGNVSDGSLMHVEDTPVQLPVLMHSPKAQQIWEEAQVGAGNGSSTADGRDIAPQDTDAVPPPSTPDVRRNLSADFGAQLSDAFVSCTSGESESIDTQFFLSVFLVSMASISYQSVAALARDGENASLCLDGNLKLSLANYDCVLLVEPTGWCKRCVTRDINDKLTLLKVPYSEHCGFHEMISFVQFMNPARVVPTVSEENFKKHEALFVEKAPRLRSRVSNVQPITRFFAAAPPHNDDTETVVKTEAPGTHTEKPNAFIVATSAHHNKHTAAATNVRLSPCERRAVVSQSASTTDMSVVFTVKATLSVCQEESKLNNVAEPEAPTNGGKKRPASGNERRSAEAATTINSGAQRLDRLFKRTRTHADNCENVCKLAVATKTDASSRSDDDEDCQVVRIVQTVVEISDDD